MIIPYTSLPGWSNLFLDYIKNFRRVSAFYGKGYDKEGLFKSVTEKKKNYNSGKINREELAEILKTQNKFFNSHKSAFKNIELIRENDTFAIVTGQQIGMLTGNLYTVVKALNAVQLSKKLSKQFPEFNFVPVFWLESDDHDFLEINNINIADKQNNPANIKYFEKDAEKERYLTPTGRIALDASINGFISRIRENLAETEFTETLFDFISRSYKEGIDLATAFARFFNYISGDIGMVFINPSDKEIKNLLIPVFEKELNNFPKTSEIVINTSAELERLYEPQVKPRAINLFYAYNDNRHLIEPKDLGFSLRNTRQKFGKNELFELLYTNPENFSANVILRPVCQDFLLPTVAYVAGPSEIAYFAQLKDVYEFFNVTMPVIFPRTTVTLAERRIVNFTEKYDLGFEDLFDEQLVTSKIAGKISEISAENLFSNYIDEMNALMYKLNLELGSIDKNLTNTLKSKFDRYVENLAFIRQKFVDSQIKQNDFLLKKIKSVLSIIYPEDTYQERYYNIISFINKYGFDLIPGLLNRIDIDKYGHQIVGLETEEIEDTVNLFGSS
ncbi:MAG: bacillithiol biosynthesis cysteine-adding enzyme BshC [Ignavibacteriae bacterium]|nr:bacillithiol biosynthesis cysteine-adding enzyme BshC [Ignavibacteriota bacterium]